MWVRFAGLVFALAGALLLAAPASAHANLARSSPGANETLTESPTEIRLWFTEPLEPDYSRITLLDMNGDTISPAPSSVDPEDAHQMTLAVDDLPDGVYTVSWRSLSTTDGHLAQGSYAFGVGMPAPAREAAPPVSEDAPPGLIAGRWLNLAAMSLFVGSLGFRLLVWRPAQVTTRALDADRRLQVLTWAGWYLLGAAQVLLLLLQTAVAAGDVTVDSTSQMLANSSYGALWLARAGLWLVSGVLLVWSRASARMLWAALVVSVTLVFLHSLSSHAAAAPDALVAAASDGLHLLATCLWVGGLVAFALALIRTRLTALEVGELVGWFSNYARLALAALVVTGIYAAWLHVGSVEALLATVYGRSLLVKLVLLLPLLAIAAVNLLLTHRALMKRYPAWIGRLRGLIGAEVALLVGILAAAGLMTALNPARGVMAANAAVAAANEAMAAATPYFDMRSANHLMAHLEIVPGMVGENTFTVSLIDETTGAVIDDASLIRLRFDHRNGDVGQSELRPEAQGNSLYRASGSNLSLPGDWRIRMTVARPGEFDSVIDFDASIPAAPPPPQIDIDLPIPAVQRGTTALLAGLALLALGGYAVVQPRARRVGVVLVGVIGLVAIISLVTGAQLLIASGGSVTAADAWARPAPAGETGAVYVTIDNPTADSVRLVEAATSAAERVELHQTVVEDGIARMERIAVLDIPPGETARIEPLGLHLMLVNLQADLVAGASFPLTLTFSSGETLTLDARVRMNAGG